MYGLGQIAGSTPIRLDDDVLIHICSFLTIPSILSFRQTCKRLFAITKLHTVWHTLFHTCVLARGFPFPPEALPTQNLSSEKLEHYTRRAHRISLFWNSPSSSTSQKPPRSQREMKPRFATRFNTFTKGTSIFGIRFLPGHDARRIVTVSKGIWSVITCWDLGGIPLGSAWGCHSSGLRPQKIAEWCPKSVILTGFTVNSKMGMDESGLVAVGLDRAGVHSIEILSLRPTSGQGAGSEAILPFTFECVKVIETSHNPITFQGDILVSSNEYMISQILDLKTDESVVLEQPRPPNESGWLPNKCLQAVLTEDHIFIVRARTIEIYTRPKFPLPPSPPGPDQEDPSLPLRPVCRTSFGWVDGISLASHPKPQRWPSSSRTIQGGRRSYSRSTEDEMSDHESSLWNPAPFYSAVTATFRSVSADPWLSERSMISVYGFMPNPWYTLPVGDTPPTPTISTSQDEERNLTESPYLTASNCLAHLTHDSSYSASSGEPHPPHTFIKSPSVFSPTVPSLSSSSFYSSYTTRPLRCPRILSGPKGTAIWIKPPKTRLVESRGSKYKNWREVGLATFDVHSSRAQGLVEEYDERSLSLGEDGDWDEDENEEEGGGGGTSSTRLNGPLFSFPSGRGQRRVRPRDRRLDEELAETLVGAILPPGVRDRLGIEFEWDSWEDADIGRQTGNEGGRGRGKDKLRWEGEEEDESEGENGSGAPTTSGLKREETYHRRKLCSLTSPSYTATSPNTSVRHIPSPSSPVNYAFSTFVSKPSPPTPTLLSSPNGGGGEGGGGGSVSWTAIDYCENWGRVVIGSSDGWVTFVEL